VVRTFRVTAACAIASVTVAVASRGQNPARGVAVAGVDRARESQHVTISVEDMPLTAVVHAIAQQAGLTPIFEAAIIPASARVTLHVRNVDVRDAFQQALRGTGLVAHVRDEGDVTIIRDGTSAHVDGGLTVHVVDARTRHPLSGVKVVLDGATRAVATDDNGMSRVAHVSAGDHVVTIKMLGYSRVTRTVAIQDGATVTLEVALETSATALDQVVVTGTVVATELKAVPNAMTVITAKELQERGITHLDQLFRGDIPGLFATNYSSSAPLGQIFMFSRGNTQMSAGNWTSQPIKTYVDGIELADPQWLSKIDPTSIDRIEVLTGPQASTIYGSNALNGVMQIFTKRGSSARPQLTATLQSGFIQNNFSSALTPQHDEAIQLNGIDGHLSYNVGGSWIYMGRWTPSVQTAASSGFGGLRASQGPVVADVSLRVTSTVSKAHGSNGEEYNKLYTNGFLLANGYSGITVPRDQSIAATTMGTTVTYTPVPWWSNTVRLGNDEEATGGQSRARQYASPSDTSMFTSQGNTTRRSIQWTSTVNLPLTTLAQATLTGGVDGWNSMTSNASGRLSGTGAYNVSPVFSKITTHNRGMFFQGQLGIHDALFFTYGLRAEWNPNYGADAEPNLAPRYGVAYTQQFGSVTAKIRAAYGRSTRPPDQITQKSGRNDQGYCHYSNRFLALFGGQPYCLLPNPSLEPEDQRGGEGGLELYFGSRGSLVVTRYNQTVDNLIYGFPDDSIRSQVPCLSIYTTGCPFTADAQGYAYYAPDKNQNTGSIRNQGWELQGTTNVGPLTAHGTYSWTKSRWLGTSPQFVALAQAQFPYLLPYFTPGVTFGKVPEHTWALTTGYAHGGTSLSVTLNGVGSFANGNFFNVGAGVSANARLVNSMARTDFSTVCCDFPTSGYAMADLNASQRFTARVQGLLTIKNLSDDYREDTSGAYAVLGRQTSFGLRITW